MTDRGGEREGTSEIEIRSTNAGPRRVLAGLSGVLRVRISISESLLAAAWWGLRGGGPERQSRRRRRARAGRRPALATERVGGRVHRVALADDSDRPRRTRRAASRGTPRGRVLGRPDESDGSTGTDFWDGLFPIRKLLSRRTDERRSRRAFVTSSLPLETREGTARVSCFLNLDFLFHVEHMRRTARRMIGARAKELRERITLRDRGEGTRVSRSLLVQQGHRVSALS